MRWTINWFGKFYSDDTEGWNSRETNSWAEAITDFTFLNDEGIECYLEDNEYGCSLHWDNGVPEWR